MCLLTSSSIAFSQSTYNLTGLLRSHPQANLIHPAYAPEAEWVVGVPLFSSFSVGLRNEFSHSDLFTSISSKSTLLDVGRLYKNTLGARNFFSSQLTGNLLYVGYQSEDSKSYISFHVHERLDFFSGYSKSLVGFFWNGNASLLGGRERFSSLRLDAAYFREYGITTSVRTNGPLLVGIGVKLFQGISHFGLSDNAAFEISVADDTYQHLINTNNTHLRSSGFFSAMLDVDDGYLVADGASILSRHLFGFGSVGLGFDVGACYPISDMDLNLSLSLKDVGYIDWREDVEYYTLQDDVISYAGIGELEGGGLSDRVKDSFEEAFTFEKITGADAKDPIYRTVLPASLLFTADWVPSSVAGLAFTSLQIQRRGDYYFFSPLLGYTHTFFSQLHLSGVLLSPALDAPAMGLTMAYNPGPFYIYLSTTGLPNITAMQSYTFSFGMSFIFRPPVEDDTPYVKPPALRKRYRFLPRFDA